MASLRDLFSKYTGFLRSIKLVYIINNFLNRKKLEHNKALYKKYEVEKSIYSNIGHKDFKKTKKGQPLVDQPNALEIIRQDARYQSFNKTTQIQIARFIEDGYMILKGFYTKEEVAQLNDEIDGLLKAKKTDFNYTGRKVMDAFNISTAANQFFKNKELLDILNFVMGRKVIPFQTINFIKGSEQKAHSDSIHMTTEPEGFLIATWTALEPTHKGNGPLFYYPKSHRLPFVSTSDYDSGNTAFRLGEDSYKKYEDKIGEVIANANLEKQYFFAEPGDVLIWHANLLHGGSPITQEGVTRKSMVAHYYCEDVICYHEITQRPALLDVANRK